MRSAAYDQALGKVTGGNTSALDLAENLLQLLAIDGGSHVPMGLADALETSVYRLATLPRDQEFARMANAIKNYEQRKWVALLTGGLDCDPQ